jgi:hypothetical protein
MSAKDLSGSTPAFAVLNSVAVKPRSFPLLINNFTEEDYAAWGTTRNDLLKVITEAWFSTR